jgi:TolB-like protein
MMTEALPEDLGSALTRTGFQVASRTNVQQLGAAADARAAAINLGVDGVLDGTIRMQGTGVRIYVELIDARTGFQVWSNTFAADVAALVAGQGATATEIASQIRAAAGGQR